MKKLLSFLACSLIASAAYAAPANLYQYAADLSDSGGATVTASVAASTGRKIVVWGVVGRSDLSTSVIQLQEADAAGVTGNYTTIMKFSVGAATATYQLQNGPLFVGKPNYAYRFLLDSTTANALLVTFTKE